MVASEGFICAVCGQKHDALNLTLGATEPALWHIISDEERSRSALSGDQCIIQSREGPSYYVRGNLDIPVRGAGRTFTWGVWCSLSEKSFNEVGEHWNDPRRVQIGPHFGWLCNPVPTYPDTMYLKAQVRQREPGQVPLIELEPTDHPLAVHQQDGIDLVDLNRRIVAVLHPSES